MTRPINRRQFLKVSAGALAVGVTGRCCRFDFDTDALDAIDDLPDFHHILKELGWQDLTATARFKIEEKIRDHLSATLGPYRDMPRTDYLDTPTVIELTTLLPDYEIHAFSSINVPFGLTREQIIENARAAGTIPDTTQICQYLATTSN